MIRWGVLLLAVVVVLAAIVFGIINLDSVRLDLLFGAFNAPVGILVLVALLLGALAGGLTVYVGVVLPLRVRLGRARREIKTAADSIRA